MYLTTIKHNANVYLVIDRLYLLLLSLLSLLSQRKMPNIYTNIFYITDMCVCVCVFGVHLV